MYGNHDPVLSIIVKISLCCYTPVLAQGKLPVGRDSSSDLGRNSLSLPQVTTQDNRLLDTHPFIMRILGLTGYTEW